MKLLIWIWIAVLYSISYLPIFVLHRFSDLSDFVVYYGLRYRKKVVRENLALAFPALSASERMLIEKRYFKNVCDLIFEAIKTFTISAEELSARCVYQTPEVTERLFHEGKNLAGISSHLANWEWLGLLLGRILPQQAFAVYKPLSSGYLNDLVLKSRERFGVRFIAIKSLRTLFQFEHTKPYIVGLLSDQAPHDYSKAFEVTFLGQKTFVAPGPAVLCAQKGMTPVWGYMRRVRRSQYEWGVEVLKPVLPSQWSKEDQAQIERIARAHRLTNEQAAEGLALTQLYTQKLETEIKMAPQDWLWSHRRWKSR